jgi:uncharacterized protein
MSFLLAIAPALPDWLYPLLFLTGLAAGFVDSVAGGGGIITIPVLLSTGMSTADALGTNKLQACFGSATATWSYARAGLIDFRTSGLGVLCTALGAAAGTWLVAHQVDPDFLRRLIPWLLVGIAGWLLVQPDLGTLDLRPRLGAGVFQVGFGLLIGFYDGFFGPGTGTFWAMAYLLGLGYNLQRGTAHTKLMNFTSNVVSLGVFAAAGHVWLAPAVCMGAGQVIGARLGSRTVIRRGAGFIRPLFILMALAVTARLLWLNYGPGR